MNKIRCVYCDQVFETELIFDDAEYPRKSYAKCGVCGAIVVVFRPDPKTERPT